MILSQAFDHLRAEHEQPWLTRAFVPPPNFDTWLSARPMVLFGESGSGKTALRMMLAERAQRTDGTLSHLVAHWCPEPLDGSEDALSRTTRQVWQATEICVYALLRFVGNHPEYFGQIPGWAKDALIAITQRCFGNNGSLYLAKLEREVARDGLTVLRYIAAQPALQILPSDSSAIEVLRELVVVVNQMGLAGIWLFIDGLEPWLQSDTNSLASNLHALLSTLAWFEIPGFTLKLMLPTELRAALASSGAISRQRLDVRPLQWSEVDLTRIIEKRLCLALDRVDITLATVCASDQALVRLREYGGSSPRGWLEMVRPLVEAYVQSDKQEPLSTEQAEVVQRHHPPKLRLDMSSKRVFVGYREKKLQPQSFDLLSYLYHHYPNLVTTSELYYRVHLKQEPPTDRNPGLKDSPDNATYQMLLRLRKSIEEDHRHPIYIITEHKQGVRLDNVA